MRAPELSGAGRKPSTLSAIAGRPARSVWDVAAVIALLLACGMSAAVIAQAVPAVIRFRDAFPFWDMVVVDYRYFVGPPRDFWVLRDNDHLPLFAMPLFWADLRLFKGQGTFLVLGTLALAAGIALAPAGAILRHAGGNRLARITGVVVPLAMFLWLGNHFNLKWPKQIHMYMAMFGVVMAIRIAAAMKPDAIRSTLAAGAWLVLATFSFGYGIIGFPVVIALCAARRAGWRPAAIFAVILAACLALYLAIEYGLVLGTAQPRPHTMIAPLYVLTFAASPVLNLLRVLIPAQPALIVAWGLTGLALAVYAWQAFRCLARAPSELCAWGLALGLFTLCNGAETSIGRAFFGYGQAADERYIVGQLPLWVGLILFGLDAAARPRARATLAAGLAFAAAALLASQQPFLRAMRDAAAIRMDAAIAAIDHVDAPALIGSIQPIFPAEIPVVIEGLRARNWGMFAWKQAKWPGRPLSTFGTPTTGCIGHFDHLAPVAGTATLRTGTPGWHAEGWAASTAPSTPVQWLLLADQNGTVEGVAHSGLSRDDVGQALHRPDAGYSGWSGYVPAGAASQSLTAYALLGKHPCRLEPVQKAAP